MAAVTQSQVSTKIDIFFHPQAQSGLLCKHNNWRWLKNQLAKNYLLFVIWPGAVLVLHGILYIHPAEVED